MPHIYNAPNIPLAKHAFFGRKGGVSKGIYNSLNFNYRGNDKPENLSRNLDIIGAYYGFDGSRVVRLLQAHTNKSVYIDKPSQYEIEADGVVTDQTGIILGVTTADCIPVLLADYKNGIIGAAHAGWRGALSGVVENTIKLMLERGAEISEIAVATGPCLQKENFETKDDMRDMFLAQSNENQQFFTQIGDGKYLCNLEEYVKYRVKLLGINNIFTSGIDTYSNPDLYFSYRRSCHQNLIKQAGDFGIELSTICL
ncbi:MAG: peptidoglycan editing factor PgeF [Alphaproteobacteria bacterium]|nr:peptidoglycan editing factor PgeF [Alphaproteobacteria bacterium]